MAKTEKNILSLNHEKLMGFFLKSELLWNNDWLKAKLTTNIPYDSVVSGETLKKVTPVITFRETRRYEDTFRSSDE